MLLCVEVAASGIQIQALRSGDQPRESLMLDDRTSRLDISRISAMIAAARQPFAVAPLRARCRFAKIDGGFWDERSKISSDFCPWPALPRPRGGGYAPSSRCSSMPAELLEQFSNACIANRQLQPSQLQERNRRVRHIWPASHAQSATTRHAALGRSSACGCRKSCHAHLSWDSCSQAVSVNQQQGQAGLRHDQFS